MSQIYPDLQTNFPDNLDTYKIYQDVNADNVTYIEQIKTDISNHNFDGVKTIMNAHPELNQVIMSAALLQRHEDQILAIQRTWLSNIKNTITGIIHYRNDYNSSNTYNMLDIVNFSNRCYLCTSPTAINGVPPTDTTNWVLQDVKGQAGTGMAFYTTWDNKISYKTMDCVPYSNKLYVSIVDNNLNHIPSDNSSSDYWKQIIVVPRQVIWSNTQPTNQDANDVWYKTNDTDSTFEIYECQGNDSYIKKIPSLVAENIKYQDGTNIEDNSAKKSHIISTTLTVAGWTGSEAPFIQNLAVDGVTTASNQEILPTVDVTSNELQVLQAADLQDGGQTTNSITFKAFGEKPDIDLPIRIIIRGDM